MTNPFDEYSLSPGALASLTEPTPDLQRNYRARGMLDNIGQSDVNGRWKYSLADLMTMWIGDRLALRGMAMDRRDALRLGRQLSREVIGIYLKLRLDLPITTPRYAVYLADGYSEGDRAYGQEFLHVVGLPDLQDKEFDRAEVIDLHRLAKTIPEGIEALLNVAAENAGDETGAPAVVESLAD